MQIIAHRGLWKHENEKNSFLALRTAFESGFGIETDVRDFNNQIFISHDPIKDDDHPISLEHFLKNITEEQRNRMLAINIKSDGVIDKILEMLSRHNLSNYFLFDMSLPEYYKNKDKGDLFLGVSDVFQLDITLLNPCGVWLDSFKSEKWISASLINDLLHGKKKVAIVSPELHGRAHLNFWKWLLAQEFINSANIYLCTDLPLKAREFFSETKNMESQNE